MRKFAPLIVAFAGLTACASWKVVGPSPAEFLRTQAPARVRVTRTDSSKVVVQAPTLRGDTLVGTAAAGLAQRDTARQVAVPLSSIQSLAVRRSSPELTLGLLAAIVLITGILYANSMSSCCF